MATLREPRRAPRHSALQRPRQPRQGIPEEPRDFIPQVIKMTAEDLPKANPAPAAPYRHDVPEQDFLEPIQSIHENFEGFGGCGGGRKGGK